MIGSILDFARDAVGRDGSPANYHAFSEAVFCFQETNRSDLRDTLYEPALCLILQGGKQTIVDGRTLDLAQGDTVLISHHVPVQAQITDASADRPYLALIIRINMAIIREFAIEIQSMSRTSEATYSVTSAAAHDDLLETTYRLLKALDDPLESKLIGPSIYRELHLRILQAPHGGMLRRMASGDSMANGIARAIKFMREHYRDNLSVASIASEAGMSESSLHQKFRSITGTTPKQYLKMLRLQEAQNALTLQGLSVAETALATGYKSVSHFSRDYARYFGAPPKTARAPG